MTLITDREIKQQQAPAKPKTVWETDPKGVKGFGVRLFPSGVKSFFINYRVDGVEKRHTIGRYPTWSVEAARAEAKDLRRRVDKGEDPADERKARRDAPTFNDLAERYRTEHLPRKAASSQTNDWAMLVNEILPRIGNRKVADVHLGDMEALHRAITESGRPKRANRVIAVASKMFSLSSSRSRARPRPGEMRCKVTPARASPETPSRAASASTQRPSSRR